MSHDEHGAQPLSKEYAGQVLTIASAARVVGFLVLLGALAAAIYLRVAGRTGGPFFWALFFIVYGACIVRAAEDQKTSLASH